MGRRVLEMEGRRGKQATETEKRRWMNAVREDMLEVGVDEEDTADWEKWRARKCYGNPE